LFTYDVHRDSIPAQQDTPTTAAAKVVGEDMSEDSEEEGCDGDQAGGEGHVPADPLAARRAAVETGRLEKKATLAAQAIARKGKKKAADAAAAAENMKNMDAFTAPAIDIEALLKKVAAVAGPSSAADTTHVKRYGNACMCA
jgi:hypothetical protein